MDIWLACVDGDIEYVERYLDSGGNIDAKDHNFRGDTILMHASKYGHKDIVGLLLSRGANIEAQDFNEQTALMYASFNKRNDIVAFLLDHNANIEARDDEGRTALMHALDCVITETLLDHGANIDAQDDDGWTALIWASWCGREDILKYLVVRGANVNIQDSEGRTAFANACRRKKILIMQIMIHNESIPYSGVAVSSFVPQSSDVDVSDYARLTKELIPMYLKRAVKDPDFGITMQRDIEEILGGKKRRGRLSLTNEDKTLLTKLLKTLGSIDYTDHISQEKDKKTFQAYDMEL